MYMVTTSFMKILNFFEILEILKNFEIFEILKFCENFEILYFKIFSFFYFRILEFLEIFEILIFLENFRVFVNRRWSPSVPNKYKTFIQSVAELKIRENDLHCRSIVLKTMDRSIVKELEKVKNSNNNVENFVVMFIYWGTIT